MWPDKGSLLIHSHNASRVALIALIGVASTIAVLLSAAGAAHAYSETYCGGSPLYDNYECRTQTEHSLIYNRAANNYPETINIAMITAAGNLRGGKWFGASYQARMCFVYDTPMTTAHAENLYPNSHSWYVDAVANNLTYDSGCAV